MLNALVAVHISFRETDMGKQSMWHWQVALGQIIHRADELLPFTSPFPLDDVLAAALLIFFGLKTLKVN